MVSPTSRRAGGAEASADSAERPTKSPGLSNFTTRPRPASNGVMDGPSSLPYSGMPASSRSVSRAARPAGTSPDGAPAAKIASHTATASDGRQYTSKPSSPVYPVRATQHGRPATEPNAPA